MHYVGLSRVTCSENLHILHLNEKKIAVSTAVINEMRRLREECKLQFCVENLLNDHSTASIVSFFNIRSLHRHIHDLRKDFSVLASDIIFVSESRLMASDDHESVFLQGFTLHRSDFKAEGIGRPVYGLAVYVKNTITCQVANLKENLFEKVQVLSVDFEVGEQIITFIFLYIPPKTNKETVRSIINCILTMHTSNANSIILAGDFNLDNLAEDYLVKYMIDKFNVQYLKTSSTTDYNSALDHMYTNVLHDKILTWGTQESYYSDHKPLFISFRR